MSLSSHDYTLKAFVLNKFTQEKIDLDLEDLLDYTRFVIKKVLKDL